MRRYLFRAIVMLSLFVSVFFVSCDNSSKEPEKATYTVTFDYGYEVEKTVKNVLEGDKVEKPSDPERTGYTFVEWQLGGAKYDFDSAVTGNITLTALWSAGRFTVTFDSDGGTPTSYSDEIVEYDKLLTEPEAPTKEGYSFLGWYEGETLFDFNTKITRNYSLKAKWTEKVYHTVKVKKDYYDKGVTYKVESGTLFQRPEDPVDEEEYVFAGWYLFDEETSGWAEEEYDFSTPVTSDITIAGYWDNRKFTVTFDSDGGEPASYDTKTVEYNYYVTNPGTPTKDGFNFLGWYDGETLFDFNTKITRNYSLKAKWEEKTYYTLSFNSDGGTSVTSQTIEKGGKATRPADPEKDGVYFHAWVYADDSSRLFDFDNDTVGANIELKAVWKTPYNIGDKGPAGGWIFYDAGSVQKSTYVDSEGNTVTYYWRYLEASPEEFEITDEGTTYNTFVFGYYYNTKTAEFGTVGAQSKDIGDGKKNTSLLVNAMGSEAYNDGDTSSEKTDRYAAKVCDDFSLVNGGVTYDDWFLPSLDELTEVYNNLYKATPSIGGFNASWYWSSSEESFSTSYVVKFQDGGASVSPARKESVRVRPVRAL